MLICQCHYHVKPMRTHFCPFIDNSGCKVFILSDRNKLYCICEICMTGPRTNTQQKLIETDIKKTSYFCIAQFLIRIKIRYLADGSCSEPILGFAGPQGSSTLSLTSNESWVHALQYLWAALHVCKLQGKDKYSKQNCMS